MIAWYIVGYLLIGFLSAGVVIGSVNDKDLDSMAASCIILWPIIWVMLLGMFIGSQLKKYFP